MPVPFFIWFQIFSKLTSNKIKTPFLQKEKRGHLIQSMTPSIKGCFEEDALLPNMSMGQEGMKVKGYATRLSCQSS
jgi:hypothetical protein